MRYLVDTHALLWALGQPDRLSSPARDALDDAANVVVVSSASLWECAVKASLGKLEIPEDFFDRVPEAGYEILPIRVPHLKAFQRLPMLHRDPFDRMLVAQARVESLTLISRAAEIARYDVEVLVC